MPRRKSDASDTQPSDTDVASRCIEEQLQECQRGDLVIKVGSQLRIRPGKGSKDYLAEVTGIRRVQQARSSPGRSAPSSKTFLDVRWFYYPEETLMKAKASWLGANEVLSSDHVDSVELATVQGEVQVHTLAQYMRLQARDPQRDFCTRVHYMAAAKRFEPEDLEVFCTCQMPLNPDLPMIKCPGTCSSWYHPPCMGIPYDQVDRVRDWSCPQCSAQQAAAAGAGAGAQAEAMECNA